MEYSLQDAVKIIEDTKQLGYAKAHIPDFRLSKDVVSDLKSQGYTVKYRPDMEDYEIS